MFGQTVSSGDIYVIGALIVLEGLLSADNAMVLAIMVRHLPEKLQRKALLYGLGGAFILRSIMIALATIIIQFWWLQLIGALYLVWLPIKHFFSHASGGMKNKGGGFWTTVARVEMVDLAFALDSVLAGVALVNTARNPDKTWVVIAGGVIGLVILRFAAGVFIRLLNKYPVLDHMAYALVGWAGVKMVTVAGHTYHEWAEKTPGVEPLLNIPEMNPTIFWVGMALIAVVGVMLAVKQGPAPMSEEAEEATEFFESTADEFDVDDAETVGFTADNEPLSSIDESEPDIPDAKEESGKVP